MKIKVLALTFSMLFFGGITATSIAQVVSVNNATTIVNNDDDDKDKKNNKKTKTAKCDEVKSKGCNEVQKKSCCGHDKAKNDGCKDKKGDKGKK